MDIEKALRNYLNSKGPKVKVNDFCNALDNNDINAIINVIFKLTNDEIDTMNDSKCLDRVVEVLKFIEVILNNYSGVNKKLLKRRINRLDEKLDRILREQKKYFSNLNKIKSEFNKVRRELDELANQNQEKDTRKYDFMKYLIHEEKNIDFLEFALKKTPSLANVKDKDDTPLFKNLVKRYLESVEVYDEENILYFGNLISLIISQNKFQLTDIDRKKCLEEIYSFINNLSSKKSLSKINKNKIDSLKYLVDLIKKQDTKSNDISEFASKYKIKVYFDEDILEQAKVVRKKVEGEMTSRESVEDYTISIDGDGAIEIDDALSCKKLDNGNLLLGIHVASVLGYFPYESDLIQEAINRAQSIYLPKKYIDSNNELSKIIPIFPNEFVRERASLKEGENRLARTYYFEIDKDGKIVSERFNKTIIKLDKKMSHNEVNNILNNGTDNYELQELINNLKEVTSILEKKYKPNELYEKVKENREDISELKVKKVGSEKIVYYAMLLTGNRVAEYFSKNNYPCPYRVHYVNQENTQKLQIMIDSLSKAYGGEQFNSLYQLIDGIYPKGWYDVKGSHQGLNLEHYCHCTSTLRRSADIIIEHALEICYDIEPTYDELEELKEEVATKVIELNSKQNLINWFIKDYQKLKRR